MDDGVTSRVLSVNLAGVHLNPDKRGEALTGIVKTDLELAVTVPRIPCGTFRVWMGERGWLRTFSRAARPGPYLGTGETYSWAPRVQEDP